MGRVDWKPGIHHIEWWVSDWKRSGSFYDGLFQRIGWRKLGERAYSSGSTEIYFVERPGLVRTDMPGPRHLCFQATSREMVEEVYRWVTEQGIEILRGPTEFPQYSEGYYTVDFRDPDGFILEVAHTPNMKL
jgi:catechol 2,3-dioxygenase-like lactoylglutathione lyase family enzyme